MKGNSVKLVPVAKSCAPVSKINVWYFIAELLESFSLLKQ
jgi:hypothetical protein